MIKRWYEDYIVPLTIGLEIKFWLLGRRERLLQWLGRHLPPGYGTVGVDEFGAWVYGLTEDEVKTLGMCTVPASFLSEEDETQPPSMEV